LVRSIHINLKLNIAMGEEISASIKVRCSLKALRKFLILSCCRSFMPTEYFDDEEVFPERLGEQGLIYTEAEDKVTLQTLHEVQFVRAVNVIGATYNSKSGSTKLKWEHTIGDTGKLSGEASINSVLKLVEAGVISPPSFQSFQGSRNFR